MKIDMDTYLLGIALIGALVGLFFRRLKNKAVQRNACYDLYAVRDELICLVAEGTLEESSRIFKYYYERINRLLALTPNMGIDNAMDAFLYLKTDKGFEHSLKEANRRADEMLSLAEKETENVSIVIANYYAASKNVMLAHSSLLRALFMVFVKSPLSNLLNKIIPKLGVASTLNPFNYGVSLRVVNFADMEENRFRNISFTQAVV